MNNRNVPIIDNTTMHAHKASEWLQILDYIERDPKVVKDNAAFLRVVRDTVRQQKPDAPCMIVLRGHQIKMVFDAAVQLEFEHGDTSELPPGVSMHDAIKQMHTKLYKDKIEPLLDQAAKLCIDANMSFVFATQMGDGTVPGDNRKGMVAVVTSDAHGACPNIELARAILNNDTQISSIEIPEAMRDLMASNPNDPDFGYKLGRAAAKSGDPRAVALAIFLGVLKKDDDRDCDCDGCKEVRRLVAELEEKHGSSKEVLDKMRAAWNSRYGTQ